MTPGLAGPPFPRGAAKGSVVAVASLEKPSVPMVVGVCEIDISALITARGEKGRAVRGMHWAGDELWSFSVGGQPGTLAAESIEGWGSELVGLDTKMGQLEIDERTVPGGGEESVHEADGSPPPQPERNQFVEGEDGSLFERVDVADNPLSTKGAYDDVKIMGTRLTDHDIHRNRRSLPSSLPLRRPAPSQN